MAIVKRNKEQSKERFLNAVGQILISKGYSALKVNYVAEVAGLDKKLIYKYFGSFGQLVDEYISSKDFWSNVKDDKVPNTITDGGLAFTEAMLIAQFDYIFKDKEFQKIILWRLSEERDSLAKLTSEQEKAGEALFDAIIDPHFGKNAQQFRAISAILVSGIYYLNLYAEINGSVFCGIDLKSEEGRNSIKEALSFILNQSYANL